MPFTAVAANAATACVDLDRIFRQSEGFFKWAFEWKRNINETIFISHRKYILHSICITYRIIINEHHTLFPISQRLLQTEINFFRWKVENDCKFYEFM